MRPSGFTGKKVVVLGLGLHGGGVAVARWLARQGAKVTVTDLKNRTELATSLKKLKGLPIKYHFGSHPLKLLTDCELVVQNPAVPSAHPFLSAAKKRGLRIENEASLFLQLCPTEYLTAITGTRGKSTTANLLGLILKRAWPKTIVAGNIRDQVLFDILDKITPQTRLVLELSSWQLEQVGSHHLPLPLAVVTNVLPDHLNRYPSLAAYARAKAMIFTAQKPNQAVVLNYDNPLTRKFARQAPGKVYWFSLKKLVSPGVVVKQGAIYWRQGKKNKLLFHKADWRLTGRHNLADALAAAAAAYLVGLKPQQIRLAVRNFVGLKDRLEKVGRVNQVDYYNDTTATSPEAVLAALESFPQQDIVLIAGGTDKNLAYKKMAQAIKQQVRALVLLPGTATVKLQRHLKGYQPQFLAKSMAYAVKIAAKLAAPGEVVLLSPGAASFGLFKHEFDRGESFKQEVNKLGRKNYV